mmetsp:Transcript_19485/g.38528  ORF Transcript_19485/g.38528 Transcript_19485/m.38528 type:complete len:94 (+) Transcript_19485:1969-2250(+)
MHFPTVQPTLYPPALMEPPQFPKSAIALTTTVTLQTKKTDRMAHPSQPATATNSGQDNDLDSFPLTMAEMLRDITRRFIDFRMIHIPTTDFNS